MFLLPTLIIKYVMSLCLSLPAEEPEEQLSLEELQERARAGDAGAQSRVTAHQSFPYLTSCVHWKPLPCVRLEPPSNGTQGCK